MGILISLILVFFYVYRPPWFQFMDGKLYDLAFAEIHNSKTTGTVVIVDLDEASLKEYGQWPWPRYRLALLVQKIRQAGAKGVGLDILFAESDRTSPENLQDALLRDLKVKVKFQGLPTALMDNDKLFADILKQGPFTLGFFFDFHGSSQQNDSHIKALNPAVVSTDSAADPDSFLLSSTAVLPPLPILAAAAPATGFINTVKEIDGTLRSTPLIMNYQGKIYGNLGLMTLWTSLGRPATVLKVNQGGIESLRLAKTIIPLDKQGRMWLHYRGPGRTFKYISAGDIMAGNVDPGELRGKIILIGTSAAGLQDLRTTPLDGQYPGVEAQATVIDTILAGDFLTMPDWLPGLELCLTLMTGLITAFLISWSGPKLVIPFTLMVATGCWFGSVWGFKQYHIFVSPLFPIMALGTNFTILNFLKFLSSEQDKRFVRQAFSQYVSSAVVDRIIASPEVLSLEGEEKEVSILFSDIRGFTTLSEKLSPSQVTGMLQQYLTPMTRIVTNNHGTLDKFIGDAVMAFWNAPVDVDNHRLMALSSGIAMLEALPELNKHFQKEYGFSIAIGVGVHAGVVRVGNMGSEDLFDYTILGDNVNLASRLESLTKFYSVPILVSDTMREISIDGYTIQDLDLVTVKGKSEPVALCTFRSQDGYNDQEKQRWEEGLKLYKNQEFKRALSIFEELVAEFEKFAVYEIYRERCLTFMLKAPPPEWQGVYVHTSK